MSWIQDTSFNERLLFAGSDAGGDRAAMMYSLINTAKLNGVEPEAYLTHVLSVIADHPVSKWMNSCHGTLILEQVRWTEPLFDQY